jgi:predicted nucleic acid-binding Zn ribbon protein
VLHHTNDPCSTPERVGSTFERLLVNLGMIVTGHRKSGFCIDIARTPEQASSQKRISP